MYFRYLLELNLSSTSASIFTFLFGLRLSILCFLSASDNWLKSNGSVTMALGSWYRIRKVLPSGFTTIVLKCKYIFRRFVRNDFNFLTDKFLHRFDDESLWLQPSPMTHVAMEQLHTQLISKASHTLYFWSFLFFFQYRKKIRRRELNFFASLKIFPAKTWTIDGELN